MDFYEPRANEWEADLAQLKRRLLGALGFILLVTLAGIIGFSVIDPDAGLIRAFYMTAITLTTVGYGEVIAIDSDGARIFTAVIILVGMGATLYFVSTGTAFLLEGQLGHVFRRKKMERDLTMISGHTIVCGTGPTAMYAASEIAATGRSIVLVGASAAEIEESVVDLPTIPVVIGDMTDDDILLAAGIDRADGLLACSESDNENVVVTLSARQLNPGLRIVSRLTDVQQELKIRKVGADGVVSPYHIGGLRLASELVRPTVVTFLDTMLRDTDNALRMEEVAVPSGAPIVGKTIADLRLADFPGVLIVAVRRADGAWTYNPPRTDRLRAGMSLVFMGSPDESGQLRDRVRGSRSATADSEP